jgi:hypothetical protein
VLNYILPINKDERGNKMILYIYDLKTQAFQLLLHRLTVNRSKKACLLINANTYANATENDYPFSLVKAGLFTKIYAGNLYVGNVPAAKKPAETVVLHFNKNFADIDLCLSNFEEIYTTNDRIGADVLLYLNLIKRNYFWMENTHNHWNLTPDYNCNQSLVPLFNELNAMNAFAKYATPIVRANSNLSIKALSDKKNFIVWDYDNDLVSLDNSDVLALSAIYSINFPNNCINYAMLLTNSYEVMLRSFVRETIFSVSRKYGVSSNVGEVHPQIHSIGKLIVSIEDKLAIDFFASDKSGVLYKNHPHSSYTNEEIQERYGDYCQLFTDMPFQFLAQYMKAKNIKVGKILSYASTSNEAITSELADDVCTLGSSYFKVWWYYLQLYAVVLFLEINKENKEYFDTVYAMPHIAEQFNLMAESQGFGIRANTLADLNDKTPRAVYISDETGLNGILNENVLLALRLQTVFFLNMENSTKFFGDELLPFVSTIVVNKTQIDKSTNKFPCHDEVVWFISKNKTFADELRKISFEKKLSKTGIIFSVIESTLVDTVNLFEREQQRVLKYELDSIKESLNWTMRLNSALLSLPDTNGLIMLSKTCTDFSLYCDILEVLRKQYLVALTICDTPGNCISNTVIEKLRKMGFGAFEKTLWKMYVGLICRENLVCQKITTQPIEPAIFMPTEKLYGMDICLESHAWRGKGGKNFASIVLNGKNYAVNRRGVNIVIFDVERDILIDSVCFDWHSAVCVCTR